MTTWAAAAKRALTAAAGEPPAAAAPCWLVVHERHDAAAPALVQALQGPAAARGCSVRALPLTALLGWVRWTLQVGPGGTRCSLRAPALDLSAGPAADAPGATLAAVLNRCGPVQLAAGVVDAEYKSAEWNAVLAAWLHGLPCPVVNRPQPQRLHAAWQGAAGWRRAAAARGLPVWLWSGGTVGGAVETGAFGGAFGGASGGASGGAASAAAGPFTSAAAEAGLGEFAWLLVVGDQVFEAPAATRAPAGAVCHRAAVKATRDCGFQMLVWQARPDHQGCWRITSASPWPDLRPFGPAAAAALAQLLAPGVPSAALQPQPEFTR